MHHMTTSEAYKPQPIENNKDPHTKFEGQVFAQESDSTSELLNWLKEEDDERFARLSSIVGELASFHRIKNGQEQIDLADELNLNPRHISQFEAGSPGSFSPKVFELISRSLDSSPEELLNIADEALTRREQIEEVLGHKIVMRRPDQANEERVYNRGFVLQQGEGKWYGADTVIFKTEHGKFKFSNINTRQDLDLEQAAEVSSLYMLLGNYAIAPIALFEMAQKDKGIGNE
jgi:transcriptional regulator with XRE-family HTH domain